MKKEYTKPGIMFESFTLSTSIADGCETIITNMSKGTCGYKPARFPTTVFLLDVTGCVAQADDDAYSDGNNTFCYHTPVDYMNLFNS